MAKKKQIKVVMENENGERITVPIDEFADRLGITRKEVIEGILGEKEDGVEEVIELSQFNSNLVKALTGTPPKEK